MLHGDVRDPASVRTALDGLEFDAVVDWVAFTPDHVRPTWSCSAGRTGQYVFISSASAYQTPPARLPVVESTPLRNPFWQYSRDKIACEDLLTAAYRDAGSRRRSCGPRTRTTARSCPFDGGWTVLGPDAAGQGDRRARRRHVAVDAHPPQRLRPRLRAAARASADGRRRVPHHLRRRPHLEPDRRGARRRRRRTRPRIVHVPSDAIAAADPEWGAGLLGDKAHSMVFDNCKLRARRPGLRRDDPVRAGAPARSSPGTTRIPPARWSTPGWTRSWTTWSSGSASGDG